MLKKGLVLLFSTTLMLVACHSPVYNQTEGNVAEVKLKAQEARHKSDMSAATAPALLMKQGLYADTTPVNLDKEPEWLKNHIVIRGDQLPFSYYSRTIASGAGSSVLTKYQTGLDASTNISVNYSGTIKGALDLLASKTGNVYSVRRGSIYWQAFVTRTFDVAFLPGDTDYMMGKESGGSGGSSSGGSSSGSSSGGTGGAATSNFTTSDSSDSEFSNIKGKLSVWTDLDNTIKQLLSPAGKVVVSQSTTSVTVNDRPTNVELISQYIGNLNHNLSKQVLVKVQILDIKLQSGYDFGINWNLIMNAFNQSPFKVNANYGTPVSITTLTGATVPTFGTQGNSGKIPSYTILFNALNQQGKTSVVSEPRVVCLNNQVSVVRIVKNEGYIASIQNTAGTGGSGTTTPQNTVTSQVSPGSVTTGLTLYILPKIMNNKIYMQVNADLSTNDGFQIFGGTIDPAVASSQIQLPLITEKHFNQRSVIRSGDTLILSGFRQVANQTGAMQLAESQSLGGKAAQQGNIETVILITPILLNINGTA